jgi:glycosyltransferase involved in cell wall biosynthesis
MTDSARPAGSAERRVLFVRRGSFSGTNARLLAALRRRRPDVEFDDLDIDGFFAGDTRSLARSALGALLEYGPGAFRSRAILRFRMTRNCSYFAMARARIRAWMGQRDYACSLQTQSLFDASSGRFPNLVYTDGVALAREGAVWSDGMGLPSRLWIDREREIYRNAAYVFTFGTRIRRLLIDRYGLPEDKVACAGGGASVAPEAPPPTGLARYARRHVLFVGMDWVRKGGPDLLAAFKILRARLPDVTLSIVGCSPAEAQGVEGCAVLGRLPPEKVAAEYLAASCFCMPSRYEPFGIVYLEAARFALPVVATAIGDIGDMVRDGENGWRVPPCDPVALAEALARVLASPETAQRMGAAGLALAGEWTWDAVADRILSRAPLPRPA